MYRPRLLLLLTMGVLTVVATCTLDVVTDPFGASVTSVRRGYYEDGRLRTETSFNRLGERHGLEVIYDRDGRIIEETIYERDSWRSVRELNYAQDSMRIRIPAWTPPYSQFITSPIPDEYWEYRCEERLPQEMSGPDLSPGER